MNYTDVREITLRDTVEGMLSDDHSERLVAEYQQLAIRIAKLDDMLRAHARGELDFTLSCPESMLERQLLKMRQYARCLEGRAQHEGIELGERAR